MPLSLWVTVLALALGVSAASAQQKDPRLNPPVAPLPPLSADESSSKAAPEAPDAAAPDAGQARSESRPLAGAELRTLGSGGASRNFLLASFNSYAGGDTNPQGFASNANPTAQNTVGAEFAFHRLRERSELTAQYTGNGTFYSARPDLNTTFHDFAVSQNFVWGRWKLLLDDRVSYSPDARAYSSFGNLPSGLGSAISNGLINLNPLLTPNQSILSERAARISNTVIGELDYTLSRRSTLNFSSSYGLLHFLDTGFVDGSNLGFNTGYNYALTARDTVSLSYGATLFRFDTGTALDSHTVYASYGRRIGGRLLFQISGGPQVSLVHGAALGSNTTLTSWSLNTSVQYRLSRSELALSYLRGVTGGSGVLLGAQTNQVNASLSRPLSRVWSGSLNLLYARNETLAPLAVASGSRIYNSWGGGFQLRRPVGHYAEMYFAYSAQRQTAQVPGCLGATCGFVGLRQVFGIGFNFRFRPVQID